MPARCNLFGDDSAPAGTPGVVVSGTDDGAPRSRRRGRYAGFLPGTAAADLQELQQSGVGLDAGGSGCSCGGACGCSGSARVHPLILVAAGIAIVAFFTRRDR